MKSRKEKETKDVLIKLSKEISVWLKINIITFISNYRNFNPNDQFLIFSDPRGGSTWLSEIINTIPNTAIIWEPLHLGYAEQLKDLGFGWRQYIPETVNWPEVNSFFEQVFSGKILNKWTMSNTDIIDYVYAKYFIIKICRGNMMLPWITRYFNFTYRPIHLIRHPFAVVNSQLKQGGWNQPFKKYKIQEIKYNDCFEVHKDFLESLTSREEVLTAVWCITNNVPLNHPENNNRWITIYYEDLVIDPEKEINRIFDIWGIPIPIDVDKSYRKISRTTLGEINMVNPEIQLARWKKELTEVQIEKMQMVLEYFKYKIYSYKDLTPVLENSADY
jgi:hypothetical protein